MQMSDENQVEESGDEDLISPNYQEKQTNPSILNNLQGYSESSYPKWINNQGDEVKQVFGFNKNAELINGRAAMFGFVMLLITELVFNGLPVTRTIFGIG